MTNDRAAFARQIAEEAGEILMEGLGQVHEVRRKGSDVDLVTEIDLKSEELLVRRLQSAFPDDRVRGEESGRHGNGAGEWLIDPLDGTTNYAHGLPIFCISIAYLEAGRPLVGVVHDPTRPQTFWAQEDGGAWLGSQPLQVSQVDALDRSLLVTGFPYDIRTTDDNNLAEYSLFSKKTRGVRRLGAAALDLAYVAAGWLDGFWELSLEPWDVAAGILLVNQAGGRVTRMDGGPDVLAEPISTLATNGRIHDEILRELSRVR